ncbi:MAG: glycosyltransferase family 2 protein [Gemmiger sp.]|nr:glycosyltransferase family 2 protein [Gemmiger sp.]
MPPIDPVASVAIEPAAPAQPPKFSVVVPVYNVEKYLPGCVKSVVEQPGPRDWECILVDDGATDASGRMCAAFAAEIPGVVAIHQQNAGLAAARNAGIAAATGQWLLFLDSDDEMAPGLLPRLRAALAAHPGFDWYVGRYLELDEQTGTLAPPAELAFEGGDFESEDYPARVERLYQSAHWAVWKYCIRRQFLQESGVEFWPEVLWAEDYPFDLMLLCHTKRLCFLDEQFTIYRANRAGSLLNCNQPKHFAGIAAALKRFQAEFAAGHCTEAQQAEILRRTANAFWPEARAAAVRDTATRRACAPLMRQCRPLYAYGEQCRGRADWVAYRWLVTLCGPRFALWATAHLKRGN